MRRIQADKRQAVEQNRSPIRICKINLDTTAHRFQTQFLESCHRKLAEVDSVFAPPEVPDPISPMRLTETKNILAGPAIEDIVPVPAVDGIVAEASVDFVIAARPVQGVVAMITVEKYPCRARH